MPVVNADAGLVKPTMTLAFSTVGDRLPDLLELLMKIDKSPVSILVVVQKWTEENKRQAKEFENVRFVWSETSGLSRSRNIALKYAETEFVWLLDDDVDLICKDLVELDRKVSSISEDIQIIRVKVGCSENHKNLYKTYSNKTHFHPLMALQMNSIEILFRRKWILEKGILFNENIGLGTNFPCTEECNFVLDAVREGAKVRLLNDVHVYHPCCEGGRRKAQTQQMMEIRGATASRYGILGLGLILRWGFRYWFQYKEINFLVSLVKGYRRGYGHYLLPKQSKEKY